MQQIDFSENLNEKATIFFSLLKKQKKLFWIFHKQRERILVLC